MLSYYGLRPHPTYPLFDLGLTDELEDSDELVEGCDAIFSESL